MTLPTQLTRITGTIMKIALRWKFIAINAYLKKTEAVQINNFLRSLKVFDEQKQCRIKQKLRREITNVRTEFNELETGENDTKFNKLKS